MIEWIFFDMGSTLINETESYKSWFSNASKQINGAISAIEIEKEYCAGMKIGKPTVSGQLNAYGFIGNDTSHLYPSELDKPYPEAAKVLEQLSHKYKLGIIANQKVGSESRLTQYGLRQFFDIIVASFEAGVKKPDPRIFKMALAQAQCLPENAVMTGDRLDNDIYPAKKLGMSTIWIRQGWGGMAEPISEEYEPDYSVNSLTEILNVLEELA